MTLADIYDILCKSVWPVILVSDSIYAQMIDHFDKLTDGRFQKINSLTK